MSRLGNRPDALVEALHSVQGACGFLDDDALRLVSDSLRVPASRVFGVASFCRHFTMRLLGEHTRVVCTGTACSINGASEVLTGLEEQVVEAGPIDVAVKRVGCLLLCAEGPRVEIPDMPAILARHTRRPRRNHGSSHRRDDGPGARARGAVLKPAAPIATENAGRIDPRAWRTEMPIHRVITVDALLQSLSAVGRSHPPVARGPARGAHHRHPRRPLRPLRNPYE